MEKGLQTLNSQNKLALWAGRISERNDSVSVKPDPAFCLGKKELVVLRYAKGCRSQHYCILNGGSSEGQRHGVLCASPVCVGAASIPGEVHAS